MARGGTLRRKSVGFAVVCLLLLPSCAGPSSLRRALDAQYNQVYVDSPVLGQAATPFFAAGLVLAGAVDFVVVNPFFFWRDSMRGHGTPYYFKNPMPAEADDSDGE